MCRTSVQLLASSYCPSQPCLARAVFALSSQPNRRVAPANYHMATALANGTVLLAGGYDGANFLTSAQLYVPAAESWADTGSLASARGCHTLTSLLNGKAANSSERRLRFARQPERLLRRPRTS